MKFNKYILSIILLFSALYADLTVTVTATKNNHTDKVRYFNYYNTLFIFNTFKS